MCVLLIDSSKGENAHNSFFFSLHSIVSVDNSVAIRAAKGDGNLNLFSSFLSSSQLTIIILIMHSATAADAELH